MKTKEKMDRTGLVRQFDRAGLKMELTRGPMMGSAIGPGSLAFQMDITRPNNTKGPREVFRIWPGHDENRVEVVGTNEDLQQAVLMVKEPKRVIEIEIDSWEIKMGLNRSRGDEAKWRADLAARNRTTPDRIVKKGGKWFILQQTPEVKRHYLMGMDERHLFMCQLPRAATTVVDAHKVLKAETVSEREKKNRREVARQGEWFFLRPTQEQREALEVAIKGTKAVILRKVSIGRSLGFTLGRPHTADELAVVAAPTGKMLKNMVETRRVLNPDEVVSTDTTEVPELVRTVFIRGKVKHVEHKTVEFVDWVVVIRNTEIRQAQVRSGINWID